MNWEEIPYYTFKYHGRLIAEARYYNTSGFACAVVASLSFTSRGEELLDWAAYIGGCNLTRKEHDALEWVADHGAKLSRDDACYYFPALPCELFRP